MAKFYVTTPIYYVNAKPHIGSAYTTIAADVLARYHRQQGDDTHFLTGIAEHGTKISKSAELSGQSPQQFVDQNSSYFKQAWESLNIQYDDFIRTTEPRHVEAVEAFFNKLKDSGQIYEGEYEGLYCVGHEAFIKEADLDEHGNCPDHGKPPETVKERNWFFKLSTCEDFLLEAIQSGKLAIAPAERRNEVLSFIKQGLEDITISRRTVDWAIPLPWDEEQTIYVWLDELFNYCSAIGYNQDQTTFDRYWPADIHLVGKDIIKFHCIIWPALLHAIGQPIPKKVFAHGFFTINGQKISKSLGNAIDPVELVEEYGADAIRYFILRDIPFGSDGDFSLDRLKERYNADLANGLGNLVSRTLNMIKQFWPEYNGSGSVPEYANREINSYRASFDQLAFDKALFSIWTLIGLADRKIEENKPWELARTGNIKQLTSVLQEVFQILIVVNQLIAPFMPETHIKLTKLLSAQPIKKPNQPLFARKA